MDDLESTLHITASLTHLPKGARVIVHADGVVSTWPLPRRGSLPIGRATDAAIRIDHPSVSRAHAVLHVGPPMSVEDLGSHNGTRLRGNRLEAHKRAPLTMGDVLKVGSTLLMIQPGAVPTDTTRVLGTELIVPRADKMLASGKEIDVLAIVTRGSIPFDIVLATIAASVAREHLIGSPNHEEIVVILVDAHDRVSSVRDRIAAAAVGIGVHAGIGHAASSSRTKQVDRLITGAMKDALEALPKRKKETDPRAVQHEAITLMNAATGLFAEERYEQARAMVAGALELIDDESSVATMCLISVATAAKEHGDVEYAQMLLERAGEIARRADNAAIAAFVEQQLANAPVLQTNALITLDREARILHVGDAAIDLARRKPLWLLVSALAHARKEKPGAALNRDALLDAAWQGERIHPEAALNRLYVAIATLRKLGLRDALLNRDDGYLLDPRVDLREK